MPRGMVPGIYKIDLLAVSEVQPRLSFMLRSRVNSRRKVKSQTGGQGENLHHEEAPSMVVITGYKNCTKSFTKRRNNHQGNYLQLQVITRNGRLKARELLEAESEARG